MRSGVVMSLGPWYGSSLEAKEARIARPLNTYGDADQVRGITEGCAANPTEPILCADLLVVFSQTQQQLVVETLEVLPQQGAQFNLCLTLGGK